MHTYPYPYMATKNISITKEAYDALQREKKGDESFTQTILRLAQRSGKLSDCFGGWKMTNEEENAMKRELSKGWKKATEGLVS